MTSPRSSLALSQTTPRVSRSKTVMSGGTPAAVKRRASQVVLDTDRRRVAEMLLEIEVNGQMLSAQIERLRHRFL